MAERITSQQTRKCFFELDQKYAKKFDRSIEKILNINGWSVGQPTFLNSAEKPGLQLQRRKATREDDRVNEIREL